jgi:hypothetical protein
MKSSIEHARMKEVVKEPSSVLVEGKAHVAESGSANPKATAVVAEHILG